MSINKIVSIAILFLLLSMGLFKTNADDVWIKKNNIPMWNGIDGTRYLIQFDDNIRGFFEIESASSSDSGHIKFNIWNVEDEKIIQKYTYKKSANIYPIKIEVYIDNILLYEQLNIDKFSTYSRLSFPYRPKKIMVKSLLNNGKSYQMSVNINNISASKVVYDARKKLTLVFGMLNKVFVNNSLRKIKFSCNSSIKAGPITKITSVLLKHPIFSPIGDRILGEVNIKMPIYQFSLDQYSYLGSVISGEQHYQSHVLIIKNTCETVSGKTFEVKGNIIIYRETRGFFGKKEVNK